MKRTCGGGRRGDEAVGESEEGEKEREEESRGVARALEADR